MGATEMTYRIEFEPKLDENGEWKGHTKVMLLVAKPESMTDQDHAQFLAYVHRLSLVGSYWEEHIDEFIDFDFWYQNNVSDTSNASLQ
jgi:hypothetical protein